jgi:hypothetical protein
MERPAAPGGFPGIHGFGETIMKYAVALIVPMLLATGAPAFAKGCVRGAAAGAVAGHMVGKGHAVLGAAAGCAAVHHHYAKQAKAAHK